ncbi:MAG: hypothetical protein CSA62_08365 [Planctomycetota bacterium]|nr:MAG: hypothetical protein CSA62_08365 [Planctomycetota bacterium]
MEATIKAKHPDALIELVKGSGGDFIVEVDGQEIWNKNAMGDQFPNEEELADRL